MIKWKFQNAQKVVFDKFSLSYEPEDSIEVSPDTLTRYKITAMHETDTVSYFWRVNVINDDPNSKSITGKETSNKQDSTEQESQIESEYVKGIATTTNMPFNVKVMKVNESGSEYSIKTLILDRFGNYISGFNAKDEIKLFSNCETAKNQILIKNVEEIELSKSTSLELGILLENSFNSKNINDLTNSVCKNLSSQFPNDLSAIAYYNQKLTRVLPLVENSKLSDLIADKSIKFDFGLNALYKALTKFTDSTFRQNKSSNLKAIVAINFNSDNSSLEYFPEDAVKLCKQMSIPIYIISVGSNADSYNLKLLTSATGGKFYQLPELSNDKINEVINEIIFAQKKFVNFTISKSAVSKLNCDQKRFELVYDNQTMLIKEPFKLPILDESFRIKYQSLCSFKSKSSDINFEFKDGIKSFSKVIKENPSFNIDIIGNASSEGEEEEMYDLSLDRANNIKDLMVSYGVRPSQIRVRAEGDKKPIFLIEQNEIQEFYNRRVEVKILDPNQKPYEIIAEQVQSESEALKKIEKWEDRGYSAYYDRYLDKDKNPIYRIRLWGFGTENDAENELNKLKTKFAIKFPLKVE